MVQQYLVPGCDRVAQRRAVAARAARRAAPRADVAVRVVLHRRGRRVDDVAQMSSTMAYTSSWGAANPNDGLNQALLGHAVVTGDDAVIDVEAAGAAPPSRARSPSRHDIPEDVFLSALARPRVSPSSATSAVVPYHARRVTRPRAVDGRRPPTALTRGAFGAERQGTPDPGRPVDDDLPVGAGATPRSTLAYDAVTGARWRRARDAIQSGNCQLERSSAIRPRRATAERRRVPLDGLPAGGPSRATVPSRQRYATPFCSPHHLYGRSAVAKRHTKRPTTILGLLCSASRARGGGGSVVADGNLFVSASGQPL